SSDRAAATDRPGPESRSRSRASHRSEWSRRDLPRNVERERSDTSSKGRWLRRSCFVSTRTSYQIPSEPPTDPAGPHPRASMRSRWHPSVRAEKFPSETLSEAGPLDRMLTVRSRDFAAQPWSREDLAGIAEAIRIECASQALHGVEIVLTEHL